MTQQDEIDALTNQAGQIGNDLVSAKATLQAEIDKIAGEHPTVNLDGLTAAIAPLDKAAQDLAGLKPTGT